MDLQLRSTLMIKMNFFFKYGLRGRPLFRMSLLSFDLRPYQFFVLFFSYRATVWFVTTRSTEKPSWVPFCRSVLLTCEVILVIS